ncbi:helix-turn-helix transcriptional regulator [Streptomyces sp. MOE7]|uniref:helix-turn-helix transcriptional regulator n=1 Tax=Streptomyces sp. MOE7 TaxID=1961713 RepID=UPI0009FE17AB|nr:helix-turn-helix transcriptional regulator [Streptomyces sp. MOE7]ARH89049.1 AraC family transcriptional regulator [Streptomyces sp. MOE7]ARH94951.1 AraC family transcriptional regulator [Streptomyces sp. MOE7]
MCQREWRRARVQAQRLADLARLRRVRDRIEGHYAQPLNVEALAGEVSMSAGHLSRQFRAAYGETLYAYLMTRRIERAAALLRRGDLSVTEVCFAVGCGSLGTFTTRFTELVGMAPGAFRRQASDVADGPADAGGVARAAGAAMAVEGVEACVAKQVARPVRNREAVVAGQRLA